MSARGRAMRDHVTQAAGGWTVMRWDAQAQTYRTGVTVQTRAEAREILAARQAERREDARLAHLRAHQIDASDAATCDGGDSCPMATLAEML